MTTNKNKYYILYKVERDSNDIDTINDIKYIAEFTTYDSIKDYLKCSYRDIKTMINDKLNKTMCTFKDYTIIKE